MTMQEGRKTVVCVCGFQSVETSTQQADGMNFQYVQDKNTLPMGG